jgi:hypothetical protein
MRFVLLIVGGGLITACFVSYAVSAAVEGRWRDALEGGVPALLLVVGFALNVPRQWRRLREMWDHGE